MVGLHINVKTQKEFDYLRILTLTLSVILDEEGITAVRNYFNAIFDEYFMYANSDKIWQKKPSIFDLMEKYILKGDLPKTLADWWYYFIIRDCILYSNNYDLGEIAFTQKLDRRLNNLGNILASDARGMVRQEILAIEEASVGTEDELEAYWYTLNSEACSECEARDGVRLRDIKNLNIHPNCKCSIILM